MDNSLLEFNSVSLVRDHKTILNEINWEVKPGEKWVVIGPNGAGKTSLLSLAAAWNYPTSGEVRILGEKLGDFPVHDLRTRVGWVSNSQSEIFKPQEQTKDLVMSASYAVIGRWKEEYEKVDEIRALDTMELLGAEHLADRTWGSLSEGERKKIHIARALMTDPELLLLDEPISGLDLGGREDLVSQLDFLAASASAPGIVMVTHHLEEIPFNFTHAMLMREGEIAYQGKIQEVLTTEHISEVYAQPIEVTISSDNRYSAKRTRRRGGHRNL